MCPTCSSFRETSKKTKKKKGEEKKWVKKRKEIIGCKAHVSLLGPQHPPLPKNTNDRLFFGQITLVQLCTIHLLMDFTTANNLLFPNGGLDSFFHLIF
jgi:hypothetical protein